MAAQTALTIEPAFGIGDRLEKSRTWCGIKSASAMADLLNARLADRLNRPIKASTVSAWEAGTNQPTMIRMEELIPVWVEICNEAGEALARSTSAEFIYGLRTGSFSSLLCGLDVPTGQGQLLDEDLSPVDFYSRAELALV